MTLIYQRTKLCAKEPGEQRGMIAGDYRVHNMGC